MQEFGEFLCLAKLFAMAMENRPITISQLERDAAFKSLKAMADQRSDWTQEEKAYYKMMVDFGDEATKR